MGDLSEHFSRSESACKCGCGFNTVDVELNTVLEDLHDWAGAAVHINSGCRCAYYNQQISGAVNSKHKIGRASDVYVDGKTPAEVYAYLDKKYPQKYGLGKYKTFTHIDTRNGRARWSIA